MLGEGCYDGDQYWTTDSSKCYYAFNDPHQQAYCLEGWWIDLLQTQFWCDWSTYSQEEYECAKYQMCGSGSNIIDTIVEMLQDSAEANGFDGEAYTEMVYGMVAEWETLMAEG